MLHTHTHTHTHGARNRRLVVVELATGNWGGLEGNWATTGSGTLSILLDDLEGLSTESKSGLEEC